MSVSGSVRGRRRQRVEVGGGGTDLEDPTEAGETLNGTVQYPVRPAPLSALGMDLTVLQSREPGLVLSVDCNDHGGSRRYTRSHDQTMSRGVGGFSYPAERTL